MVHLLPYSPPDSILKPLEMTYSNSFYNQLSSLLGELQIETIPSVCYDACAPPWAEILTL